MKKLILVVVLFCSFGVGSAYADFLGIGRFWEDVKRETTKAAHNTGNTIEKAWEDTKRETTNVLQPIEKVCNGDKKTCGAVITVGLGVGAAALGDPNGVIEAAKILADIL